MYTSKKEGTIKGTGTGIISPAVRRHVMALIIPERKEKESGRIDELADEYFFRYIEDDDALAPAA